MNSLHRPSSVTHQAQSEWQAGQAGTHHSVNTQELCSTPDAVHGSLQKALAQHATVNNFSIGSAGVALLQLHMNQ